jgi:hypothetical protein
VTHRKTEKERQVADGRGEWKEVGEKPNNKSGRKPGPLKMIQYSMEPSSSALSIVD